MRLRWLVCGFAFAMVQSANAADLGEMLRGSTVIAQPGPARWDGIYFGGQVGANYSGADFSGATRSLVDFILRESTLRNIANVGDWNVLGKADTSGSSWGAFVGYNMQMDDAVLGVELNYNRTNLSMASTDALALQPGGFPDTVYINGTASTRLTDYGTARVRGGWAAGSFMPYGFVGIAIGRADVSRSATVNLYDPAILPNAFYFSQTRTESKAGDFAYGYAAGLGMDICVLANLFVRGEYEYVQFGAFNDINMHIHTVRVAAGLKF
jgi:opacity protein-like surface antigen